MAEERKYYSEAEKLLLCSLIETYKETLECKKTDGVTLRKKQEAWERVTEVYNSHDVVKRNSKQLKKLWENIKQKTRKADTKRKYEVLATGGGPPPADDTDPIGERVRSIVPTIDFEIQNMFDSVAALKRNVSDTTHEEKIPASASECKVPSIDPCTPCSIQEVEIPTAGPSHDHSYDIQRDIHPKKIKRRHGNANIDYINEEAELRVQKLRESIEQQRELHKLKVEAVLQEKSYWETKKQLLNK